MAMVIEWSSVKISQSLSSFMPLKNPPWDNFFAWRIQASSKFTGCNFKDIFIGECGVLL